MRKWMLCGILAGLAGSAFAQEDKGAFDKARGWAGEQKVSFERPAFPFEGEVSVERLNVRMMTKADAPGVIASVIGLGEKVSVVGEKADFYEILPTRGCTAWIFARNVNRDGASGVVASPEAAVRSDSRVNADVLCSLKEGDKVNILSENLGWYKIEAPAAVKYYVAKKYIRPGRALEAAGPERKGVGNDEAAKPRTAGARLPAVEAMLDEQRKLIDAGRITEVDFSGVVNACEHAMAAADDPAVKAEAERLYARYRELHLVWTTLKAQKAEDDRRRREVMAPKAPEKKEWVMTGYIDTTGSTLFKRPGTHKLVMGGKIVCFLRVKDGDETMINRLNDLYERYVGVNGVLVKDPEGWPGYSVVVVEEIVPLTK